MNYVTVVDIGTSKIATMVGNLGINNTLNVISSSSYEYSGYYNAEFVEPEKFNLDIANALSKAEIDFGNKIKKVYIGVPADFSLCKTKHFIQNFADKVRIEQSDVFDIYEQANELKNNQNYVLISCTPISYVLDDGRQVVNPIGEKTSRISGEICYIYAESSFIKMVNSALKNFGIGEVEYISSTLAENNYLLTENEKNNTSLIIDCGFLTTSVSLSKGDGLLLLNSFSIGCGQITSDLSECLNISYAEAEQLKKQIILSVVPELSDGYEIKKTSGSKLINMREANDIVSARIEMICSLINKCLSSVDKKDLYKMSFYLTGGGICFIKGAKDCLSKYFGTNVQIKNPPHLQYSKPNYSTVLGLLNFAVNKEKNKKQNKLIQFFKKITKR